MPLGFFVWRERAREVGKVSAPAAAYYTININLPPPGIICKCTKQAAAAPTCILYMQGESGPLFYRAVSWVGKLFSGGPPDRPDHPMHESALN